MTTTQRTLIAVFDDRAQAEQAIKDLQNIGISYDQILICRARGPNRWDL